MLTFIVTSAFYSITEVGFRVLTPSWIFLLIAVVFASGVTAGLLGDKGPKIAASGGSTASRTDAMTKLFPESEPLTEFSVDRTL
jgi:hypothetical protein